MPTTLICRTCGLEFVFPEDSALHECPACGTAHSRPKAEGASLDVLRRANEQRASCDFVHAEQDFRRVLFDHPDEHEALWGLTLCKYGVEYVEDEKTHERKPVVHFLRRKPITEDADFRLACARAPEAVRAQYQADADYILKVQTGVLRAEAACDPCEIFLCYKASLPGGDGHTRDFDHARDLHFALSMRGYKVFFAHESLKQAAGSSYEAAIFHALHTAKVMLVVCTNADYLATPWVHSEWSRYLERVDAGEQCRLIPLLYDNCDPYSLPDAFITRGLQGLRMGELTSLDSLRQVLDKQLNRKPPEPVKPVPVEPPRQEVPKPEPVKSAPAPQPKPEAPKPEPKPEPVKPALQPKQPESQSAKTVTVNVKTESGVQTKVKQIVDAAVSEGMTAATYASAKTAAAQKSKRPLGMAVVAFAITAVLGFAIQHLCQTGGLDASILVFAATLLLVFSFVFKRGKVWMTVLACSMIPGVVAALMTYYL